MIKGLISKLPSPPTMTNGWPWTVETDAGVYDKNIQFPRITIVTPTFNQGHFIEETIRSILLQNYPNLEYIIIDGGSTDKTLEIIKKYEPWITYWVSEKDRGQSHAINKGMERATGEIVNWINSDDCLNENALLLVAEGFLDPATLCFCGYARIVFDDNKKDSKLFRTTLLDKDINTHLATCSFSQPSSFFRMSVYRNITPLEESLHMNMDMYLWYRFVCLYGLDRIRTTDKTVCTVKAQDDAKTIKHFSKSYADKQRVYDSLFVAVKKDFKPSGPVLPLQITGEVRKDINFLLLRKRFCRTHPWHMDFNGRILKVNFSLIVEWVYLLLRTIGMRTKSRKKMRLQDDLLPSKVN